MPSLYGYMLGRGKVEFNSEVLSPQFADMRAICKSRMILALKGQCLERLFATSKYNQFL
jgi:hypothetical protein